MTEIIERTALERLLQTVGGDRVFLTELIAAFLADTPKQIDVMRQAVRVRDADAFRRAAHTLKANAANFGATSFSQKSKALEDAAKQNAWQGVESRIVELELVFQDVRRALLAESKR